MARKILFLHGFFASGACIPAQTLKQYFAGQDTVLTPDLPPHPQAALAFIRQLCIRERPDMLVGNSNGSFLAQIIAAETGLPALLGNPHLEMTSFLTERIGTHTYKSPRADGNQTLVIDQPLIDAFADLQQHQWDWCLPENRDKVWGLFGENDTVARYEPLFREHYTHAYHFPGAHTPTAEEVVRHYAPLIEKILKGC